MVTDRRSINQHVIGIRLSDEELVSVQRLVEARKWSKARAAKELALAGRAHFAELVAA